MSKVGMSKVSIFKCRNVQDFRAHGIKNHKLCNYVILRTYLVIKAINLLNLT